MQFPSYANRGMVLLIFAQRCIIVSMKRTQVQIPGPLYEAVKRVAKLNDWSISEVFRRAAEQLTMEYPPFKSEHGWRLPMPKEMGKEKVPAHQWRDLIADDTGRM